MNILERRLITGCYFVYFCSCMRWARSEAEGEIERIRIIHKLEEEHPMRPCPSASLPQEGRPIPRAKCKPCVDVSCCILDEFRRLLHKNFEHVTDCLPLLTPISDDQIECPSMFVINLLTEFGYFRLSHDM